MNIITFLLIVHSVGALYLEPGSTLKTAGNSIKIGFGSCFDGLKEAAQNDNIFEDINNDQLDLWVWLGDMAYADRKVLPRKATLSERPANMLLQIPTAVHFYRKFGGFVFVHEEDRRHLFNLTYSSNEYIELRKRIPVVGVWDDHDYGVNDGDTYN